jgi:hypothetical protein
MRMARDFTGKKIGRLTAIKRVGTQYGNALWECKCECGNIVMVNSSKLISGNTKSCGCLAKENKIKQFTKHGLCKTRLYRIWQDMKGRCYNKKLPCYKNYGGKNIFVCDEWLKDFYNFYNWAINNGYKENLTIDRINPNGNYNPLNCQWITRSANTSKMWKDRGVKNEL